MRVLVTDAGLRAGLSAIWSLGRAGVKVIAASEDINAPGLQSKYAWKQFVYVSPKENVKGFQDGLLRYVMGEKPDVVLPVTDLTILPILKIRQELEKHTKLAVPEGRILKKSPDKLESLDIAKRGGLAVPKTFFPRNISEAYRAAEGIRYPVALKPRFSKEIADNKVVPHDVRYAMNRGELSGKYMIVGEVR
ncbi:MAG: hypothetical protein ABH829_02925 [archaeon]